MAPGDQTVTSCKPPPGKQPRGKPPRGRSPRRKPPRGKPTLTQLGVDPAKLDWQRSGTGDGSLEVAFVGGGADGADGANVNWVLLRVAGDPAGRVLVYDRTEWICFLDGVGRGEFG